MDSIKLSLFDLCKIMRKTCSEHTIYAEKNELIFSIAISKWVSLKVFSSIPQYGDYFCDRVKFEIEYNNGYMIRASKKLPIVSLDGEKDVLVEKIVQTIVFLKLLIIHGTSFGCGNNKVPIYDENTTSVDSYKLLPITTNTEVVLYELPTNY